MQSSHAKIVMEISKTLNEGMNYEGINIVFDTYKEISKKNLQGIEVKGMSQLSEEFFLDKRFRKNNYP